MYFEAQLLGAQVFKNAMSSWYINPLYHYEMTFIIPGNILCAETYFASLLHRLETI